MGDLIYLYGFVNHPNGDRKRGDGQAFQIPDACFFISYRDVASLARRVPEDQFGEGALEERLKDLEWLKAQLWEHEQTLEQVMKVKTVIPLKWGTLFRSEEAVQEMLKERYESIRQLLEKLEGREEWTVRIHVDRGRLSDAVCVLDPEIQRLRAATEKLPTGTAYLLTERMKILSEEVGQRTIDTMIQELFAELMKHAQESATAEPVRGEANPDGLELVFQMAFLIHRKKLPEFSHAVMQAAKQQVPQGFEIHQVGPFPPYYFCDLEMKGCVEHG